VLAAIALSPVLARPFARSVGAVLPRLWAVPGHLARENAQRNPRRTAATASALMVGLALVSAFSILGSPRPTPSVDELVDTAVRADYVVSTAVGQPFTPEVAERLRAVDGVQAVSQERFGQALIEGTETLVAAVDPAALDRTWRSTTRPAAATAWRVQGCSSTPRPAQAGLGRRGRRRAGVGHRQTAS
jgi:putative ABC transport system permease protein